MPWAFIVGSVLLFGVEHATRRGEQCDQRHDMYSPSPDYWAAARAVRKAIAGRKYNLRPVDPQSDAKEWQALQKIFKVDQNNELGEGRDTQEWSQNLFEKGEYSDLVLLTASRVDYEYGYSSYDVEKSNMFIELKASTPPRGRFTRVDGLPKKKSIDLINIQSEIGRPALDDRLNEMFLLHGTRDENVQPILSHGLKDLKLGSNGCPKKCKYDRFDNLIDPHTKCHNNMFGCGVYLADASEKIDQYGVPVDNWYFSNIKMMTQHSEELRDFMRTNNQHVFYAFVVKALLGEVKVVHFPYPSEKPEDRYAKNFSNGFYHVGNKKYHSQFIPSNQGWFRGRGLRFSEITAAADGSRTEIAYVLVYARCTRRQYMLSPSKGAFLGTLMNGQTDLCDKFHALTQSSNWTGRLRESLFGA